jgi:phosphatidylserine decarboxylase
MYHIARSEITWLKNRIIHYVHKQYAVDMTEAIQTNPSQYPSFNAFFTRELCAEARPIATSSIVSPADGKISQSGTIDGQQLIQAKGQYYSLHALLGGDTELTETYRNGSYTTVYLSPKDYHRVHMPVTGTLQQMIFIPGDLFSVSEQTAELIPGLFARNERLVCLFNTVCGPMAVIFIGAIFVGSMQTVWAGEVRSKKIQRWDYSDQAKTFATGEEIGRFNMGSTIITLFTADKINLLANLTGQAIRMGQPIAPFNTTTQVKQKANTQFATLLKKAKQIQPTMLKKSWLRHPLKQKTET